MVESYNQGTLEEEVITLGFLERPPNSLVTTSPYTPSKVGGIPVSIIWRMKVIRLGSLLRILLILRDAVTVATI